ncbi:MULTISPECIES: hypothetical protein [unclassified Pseudoalteromonas]|uniref:hypothetical protein n=1 Tax=unclassified Pseudoalteromonas TaxID=194690 RepID=UPI0005A76605|nr:MULTISPECIES: hypothetical protein [unclassified Pseudoalteromonas]
MDSCQFQNANHLTASMMSGMDHAMDTSDRMSDMDHSMESMSKMDCCDDNDHLCSMNGCVSMAVTSIYAFSHLDFASQKINQLNFFIYSQYPSSLYRPPLNS